MGFHWQIVPAAHPLLFCLHWYTMCTLAPAEKKCKYWKIVHTGQRSDEITRIKCDFVHKCVCYSKYLGAQSVTFLWKGLSMVNI